MSLLWRLLQQIASWLDECPQVRVEHVPPAAKREQIKGQRNPLELEVRFLSTRPLFRQHLSGHMRQSAWNLDRGLISGGPLPFELSSQSTPSLQHFIALGTFMFYVTLVQDTYRCWTGIMLISLQKVMRGEDTDEKHRGTMRWMHRLHTDSSCFLETPRQTESGKMADWGLTWVWHVRTVRCLKTLNIFKFYVWLKIQKDKAKHGAREEHTAGSLRHEVLGRCYIFDCPWIQRKKV